MYKHYKTYLKVSQGIYLPKIDILQKVLNALQHLNSFLPSQVANWSSKMKEEQAKDIVL